MALIPVAASWIDLASVSAGRTHSADDVPQRGVGMVLGAKTHPDRPSAFLAARLDVALELFKAGKIRAILVTGDGLERSNFETKAMREYLVERGVPPEQIVEDPAGFDTYDSCVRARDVFGVTELTVITQDYHVDGRSRSANWSALTPSGSGHHHARPFPVQLGQGRQSGVGGEPEGRVGHPDEAAAATGSCTTRRGRRAAGR